MCAAVEHGINERSPDLECVREGEYSDRRRPTSTRSVTEDTGEPMNLRHIAGATFVAALLSATTLSFAQAQTGRFVDPKDLKWEPVPSSLPAGAQRATLSGDPTKAGPFAYRNKWPAGYRIAPHSHPSDEIVTVIQGKLYFGMGDKFDEKAGHELGPGGVAIVPAGSPHYAWTKEGTIFQVNATGPWGLTFVNPNDDPRNKKP